MPQRKPRRHPGTGLGTRYGPGPSPSVVVGPCVPHITARFPAHKVRSAKFAFKAFCEVRLLGILRSSHTRSSRKLRQASYLTILILLCNTAGLTSPALRAKEVRL